MIKGALRFDEGKPDYTHIHPDVWQIMFTDEHIDVYDFNMLMNEWYYYHSDISIMATVDFKLPSIIEHATPVLEFGAKKYAALNYTKGMDFSRVMKSFRRHAISIRQGQPNDPESKLPHVGHMACNLLFAITYLKNEKLIAKYDDRPTTLKEALCQEKQPEQLGRNYFNSLETPLGMHLSIDTRNSSQEMWKSSAESRREDTNLLKSESQKRDSLTKKETSLWSL